MKDKKVFTPASIMPSTSQLKHQITKPTIVALINSLIIQHVIAMVLNHQRLIWVLL